jgi:hypothetical protein
VATAGGAEAFAGDEQLKIASSGSKRGASDYWLDQKAPAASDSALHSIHINAVHPRAALGGPRHDLQGLDLARQRLPPVN